MNCVAFVSIFLALVLCSTVHGEDDSPRDALTGLKNFVPFRTFLLSRSPVEATCRPIAPKSRTVLHSAGS